MITYIVISLGREARADGSSREDAESARRSSGSYDYD